MTYACLGLMRRSSQTSDTTMRIPFLAKLATCAKTGADPHILHPRRRMVRVHGSTLRRRPSWSASSSCGTCDAWGQPSCCCAFSTSCGASPTSSWGPTSCAMRDDVSSGPWRLVYFFFCREIHGTPVTTVTTRHIKLSPTSIHNSHTNTARKPPNKPQPQIQHFTNTPTIKTKQD